MFLSSELFSVKCNNLETYFHIFSQKFTPKKEAGDSYKSDFYKKTAKGVAHTFFIDNSVA